MGVEEMVAITKSGSWGSDNTVNDGIVDETQSTNPPSNKKGVIYTYDEMPSGASLQPLSYLERVLNLGTSE
jgi:hypothetical protein